MQCKTCGREISDTAKFCPYCGSKTEPPHNSAENKTAETAYETTANTNAEQLTVQKQTKTQKQLTVQKQTKTQKQLTVQKQAKHQKQTEKLLKTIQKTAFKQHQQAT